MPKTYKVVHSEPGPQLADYILLPYGYSYNREYLSFKTGDMVKLFNGGRYKIKSVSKIMVKQPYADDLCRMRYGVGIRAVMDRWKRNAMLEGHGAKAVSEDECLMMCYEKL